MKSKACSLCLKQCVRLHGAEDESEGSLSLSFLMKMGADNKKMPHFPSSFVKSHSRRLGSSLTLEGPSKDTWRVAIEGSFSKCAINLGLGWANFVKDHHLQPGDQLLFTLLRDSYFFVEVYDGSGCRKVGALDASNPLKLQVDSNGSTQEANAAVLESSKSLELEATKNSRKGSTPAGLAGQKRGESSALIRELVSRTKTLINLSSDGSDREGKCKLIKLAPGSERLRTSTKRGRPKKSQYLYRDFGEDDFSVFHKPRARSTRMQTASAETEVKPSRNSDARKVAPFAIPVSAYMSEKVGHEMMRYQFVIDGSLEDPVRVVERE